MRFWPYIPNRVDERFYGISVDYRHDGRTVDGREGLCSYMVAAEVGTLAELPFGLESRVIPATLAEHSRAIRRPRGPDAGPSAKRSRRTRAVLS